jgi:hypothetical protein
MFSGPARFGLLVALLWAPCGEAKSSHDADLEATLTRWQALRSEIVSARIRYRSFHNAVEGRRTIADLDAFLTTGELNAQPDSFRKFITSMNGSPFRVDPPWGLGVIVQRDRRIRNDLGPFVLIEDADLSLYHDSLNRQFDAYPPGDSRHRGDTLAAFRPLPPEPWTTEHWQIVDRSAETLVMRRIIGRAADNTSQFDPRVFQIDRTTGLITAVDREDAAAGAVQIARYLDIVHAADGTVIPRIAIEAVVRDRVVITMHALVIDELEINPPVDDTEFALAAAEGSRIVDHRGAKKLVSRLPRTEPDIVQWLKDHMPAPKPEAAVQSLPVDHSVRNALLAANGILLVAVGVVIWKKSRRPSPQQSVQP